jgi:hypothetical protein
MGRMEVGLDGGRGRLAVGFMFGHRCCRRAITALRFLVAVHLQKK